MQGPRGVVVLKIPVESIKLKLWKTSLSLLDFMTELSSPHYNSIWFLLEQIKKYWVGT